ncbi:hypothetical protein BCR33DRAFT_695729 [Rhizoclosmatium globosum]|uniref:Uncharacterized protein n=1 Tax=Rhizoclosmatium globosum TaxID=329046 RepID=A0A1Y2CNA2_9FUNG|nr:hypothetical protein BCR33DRAFT_695729 [Rhizoclosmatium globosum]|eukprot:ORY48528.1 hypothetical protein BCR33DRAFT_695729 [Rhizoclosmatium globosum]
MKESVRDQIVWAAAELSKMYLSFPAKKPHDFKIGIILSDILPETGEFDCKMVVHGLLSALSDDGPSFSGNQIVILGRRDDLSEWVNRKFPGVQIVHEWERNVKITANLSFIVLLGSAMHLTLIEEQLRGHDMSKTVLMPVLMGISVTRISTLLKSTMIITPNFNSEEEFSGDEKPQNVTWNQADIVKGASFPDLDLFRAVSREWCQCNGLDEASLQAILDHIPTTKSAAMELFQQFNLSRMYSVLLD